MSEFLLENNVIKHQKSTAHHQDQTSRDNDHSASLCADDAGVWAH